MEFVTGAIAAMSATVISNPLEVVKTRFQLQGELKAKGQHAIHYRSFFHAFYVIGRTDGLLALQQGLAASLWHQLFMNSVRLGCFEILRDKGFDKNEKGEVTMLRTAGLGAFAGIVSAFTSSPFFLIKIRLQAQSSSQIAVGYQHNFSGTYDALKSIYRDHGVTGLWRGCLGSLPRRFVGSSTQLTTFTFTKEYLANNEYFKIEGYSCTLIASIFGGIANSVAMNPFDVISTRLYNQGVDSSGRGLLYSSYFDCVRKTYKHERLRGFYKGIVPMLLRTGPHTVLLLFFWDLLKGVMPKS